MRTLLLALLAALVSLAGTVQAETLYFIHVDHLNTPRLAVGEDGVERWRWEQAEPFGENLAIELMGTEGYLINLPLRFPGQYFDKETNNLYNMMRDYDPAIGRYMQSDPIGLMGGINTYAYVGGNPVSSSDPFGLQAVTPPVRPWRAPTNGPWWGGQPRSRDQNGFSDDLLPEADKKPGVRWPDWLRPWTSSESAEDESSSDTPRERGLPPTGIKPPIPDADQCKPGPASRPSERKKGGKSLWDPRGGEWRYFPGDRWHNPHWDHNPHDRPGSPWVNVPIGGLPPVKPSP